MLDLNHGSGLIYGRAADAAEPLGARINRRIDAALEAERTNQRPRDYLGASRIGEPCARRLRKRLEAPLKSWSLGVGRCSAPVSWRCYFKAGIAWLR